jgi:hypothetical protein
MTVYGFIRKVGMIMLKKVCSSFLCLVMITTGLLAVPTSVRANVIGPGTPISATVRIEPETLNLASQGVFTAFITLPEGYDVRYIDVRTVICGVEVLTPPEIWAPAIRGTVADNKFIAKFNRQDLARDLSGVAVGDEVTLTVGGYVAGVLFEGNDAIRVISKGAH